jgi:site-specific recombinase XerD
MAVVTEREVALWDQIIDAFLFARQASGIAKSTHALYVSRLSIYRNFHIECGLPCRSPIDCSPQCIQQFFVYLSNNNRRRVTIFAYYRELRTFFRWLREIGLRKDNPMDKVTPPRPENPLPKTVTEEHFAAVMKQLDISKPSDIKWATIFTLLFDTGARANEILSLRIGDVDLRNRLLRIKGKGNKERIIPFGRTAATLLAKHLSLLAAKMKLTDEDYLFPTANRTKISIHNLHRKWKTLQKRAGVRPLPVHGLRHGFARMWLISGGDAFSLQLILGHSSPEITRRYVTLWASDLQQKYAQHSPVDRLTLVKIKER